MVFDKSGTLDYGVNITHIKKDGVLTLFYTKNGSAYSGECSAENGALKLTLNGKYSYCKQVAPFAGGEIRVFSDGTAVV